MKAHTKINPIELNTDYFPCELENAKTDNPLLKKYIETRQPKYLFEAIEKDITVLQDQIVIQTIESWRFWLNPFVRMIDEGFGGVTIGKIPVKDYECLLNRIGTSLFPPEHDSHYIISCAIGSGLIHKIPRRGTRGRPKTDIDASSKDEVHPFIKLWNQVKKAIEQNRPKNESGREIIYRGNENKNDNHRIHDYKKSFHRILDKEIPERELKYFEWTDINTITASFIAYLLKNDCAVCSNNKTPNNWHTIHRIYKRVSKLRLFKPSSVQK